MGCCSLAGRMLVSIRSRPLSIPSKGGGSLGLLDFSFFSVKRFCFNEKNQDFGFLANFYFQQLSLILAKLGILK